MNLMLDVETLSLQPDAAVFEVALVPFTSSEIGADLLHVKFMPTSGHIDPQTVKWWMEHADVCALRETAMSESDAANRIYTYMRRREDFRLWAMPTSFDCIILQELLRRNGYDMPISFRRWRDLTTVRELAWWPKMRSTEERIKHSATDDCRHQILNLLQSWRVLQSVTNQED